METIFNNSKFLLLKNVIKITHDNFLKFSKNLLTYFL